LDTLLNNVTLPTIQAVIETKRGTFNTALDALRRATPYELGRLPGLPEGFTLYQRGVTYLASGSGQDAAVQFQKLIDNRGIVAGSPLWPLAHLGLARANSLQARRAVGPTGDAARARARTAYQDFLVLWKNADPDIPILKQAKTEYARLR
jgi:hypothetical protein